MCASKVFESKKSQSIEDRIERLNQRKLYIDNYQLIYDYIKNMNTYYHITGYRFLLDNYNANEDNYHSHSSTELIALCELDRKLSVMFFEETRKIEESLRTRLANLCGENDIVTFKIDNNEKKALLLENICFTEDENVPFLAVYSYDKMSEVLYSDLYKTREEPAIKHYLNEYEGIIPIWVAINFVSFGTLIKLIECLTSIKLNEFMEGKPYKKTKRESDPSRVDLKAIHMLRNKISHHSNILGKQSPYIVKGKFYSIFYLGYQSICHWSAFLYNEEVALPLREKIDNIIDQVNKEYDTDFDFSIIQNRNIK